MRIRPRIVLRWLSYIDGEGRSAVACVSIGREDQWPAWGMLERFLEGAFIGRGGW